MQCDSCDCGEHDGTKMYYLVSDDVESDNWWAYSVDDMFILPTCGVCIVHYAEYHPDVPYHHILFGQPMQPIF